MSAHRTVTTVTTEVEDQKRCPTCKTWKSVEDFANNRSRNDGLQRTCKPCQAALSRRYREANQEKVLEYNRRYREANAEKVLECARRYREAHPDYHREYHVSRKEADPLYSRLGAGRQRARELGQEPELFHGPELLEWWDSIGVPADRCFYCSKHIDIGGDDYQLDHAVSFADGGTHTLDNIVPSCVSCNQIKRNSSIRVTRWPNGVAGPCVDKPIPTA